MRRAGVLKGQKVADLGAGRGYFTVAAAEIVGETGLVYAIEPDQTKCARIRERCNEEGLQNVRVLETGAERMGEIQSEEVDLAFSAFSLHHFSDRQAALSEIRRILRGGGAFYVWDRIPGALIRHGTQPDELKELAAGFSTFELLEASRILRVRFSK